jgi:hypothetical protein
MSAVNHPDHYQDPSGVECIEVVEHLGFCIGNAIKYIWRCNEKGAPIEDLQKGLWYVRYEHSRLAKHIYRPNDPPVYRPRQDRVEVFFAQCAPGFRRDVILILWEADRSRGYDALSRLSCAMRMIEEEIAYREAAL